MNGNCPGCACVCVSERDFLKSKAYCPKQTSSGMAFRRSARTLGHLLPINSSNISRSTTIAGSDVFQDIIDGEVYKYYAEGEWKTSSSGKSVTIYNPSTRNPQYKVQACTQDEVNRVFESAKAAQHQWAKTPLWKRAEALHKAAALLKVHKMAIAECLVKEIAKPAKDAVTEVVRSGDLISYTAEEGVRILSEGKFLVPDSFLGNERTKLCLASKIPLGVVLAIPPFNYHVNLAVSKVAPALIAGCSGSLAHDSLFPPGGLSKGPVKLCDRERL